MMLWQLLYYMAWFLANWQYICIGIIAIIGVVIFLVRFFKLSPEDRWKKVRAWLLFAVTEAELRWKSGTGSIKIAEVYDKFIGKFKWARLIMPYSTFKKLVDYALVEMRKLLKENEQLAAKVV